MRKSSGRRVTVVAEPIIVRGINGFENTGRRYRRDGRGFTGGATEVTVLGPEMCYLERKRKRLGKL